MGVPLRFMIPEAPTLLTCWHTRPLVLPSKARAQQPPQRPAAVSVNKFQGPSSGDSDAGDPGICILT